MNRTAQWRVSVVGDADNLVELIEPAVNISEELLAERFRQLTKFGNQNERSAHEWLSIEMEELGEVAREVYEINELHNKYQAETDPEKKEQLRYVMVERMVNLRKEWLQVAAVAVAAIEAFDHQAYKE